MHIFAVRKRGNNHNIIHIMTNKKLVGAGNRLYTSPLAEEFVVSFEENILSENRDMTPFVGDNDTAGDHEGGIGGNDYDL